MEATGATSARAAAGSSSSNVATVMVGFHAHLVFNLRWAGDVCKSRGHNEIP